MSSIFYDSDILRSYFQDPSEDLQCSSPLFYKHNVNKHM